MKNVSADNMRNIGLYEYVHDFLVGNYNIDGADILDIHKYIMKIHNKK